MTGPTDQHQESESAGAAVPDFTVGVTDDLLPGGGAAELDALGLHMLRAEPRVNWELISAAGTELDANDCTPCGAVILLRPRITETTLLDADRLCLIARWGVGYDNIDIDACTKAGVIVSITPDAIRRPMASGAMALLLALAHRVTGKDRAARTNGWGNRIDTLGIGLSGRVLGIVGLGNVGRDLLTLSRPFGMSHLIADPYVTADEAAAVGAMRVALEDLLSASDFVCLTCALTPETYHLINEERLARMKPDAYLINVARGGIVDQAALTRALTSGALRGAGLDTLEHEPPSPDDPLLGLDNVVLAPHSIGWTDQLVQANTAGCCQSVLDILAGGIPRHIVNPDVLGSAALQHKLDMNEIALVNARSR